MQLQDLDRILEIVFGKLQAALSTTGQAADSSDWLFEGNRIFLVSRPGCRNDYAELTNAAQNVYRAASKFREEEQGIYEIDRLHPRSEFWTASSVLIDALDYLYTATHQLIQSRTRQLGSVVDRPPSETSDQALRHEQHKQGLLKGQMTLTAAALLTNMEDRIRVAST